MGLWERSGVSREVTTASGWSERSLAKGMKGWKAVPGRSNMHLAGGLHRSPAGKPSLST